MLAHSYALSIYNDYSDGFEVVPAKKLSKLCEKFGFDIERTLIVDDSPEKCRFNYGNAVYAEPFEGDLSDTFLLDLAAYLLYVKNRATIEGSVRGFEKRGWYNEWRGKGTLEAMNS